MSCETLQCPATGADFHPNNGGNVISADVSQTPVIINAMFFGVLLTAYWKGRVITKYLQEHKHDAC